MRTVILALTITLAGCAGLTNNAFDSNEYGRYIDISTSSKMTIKQCTEKSCTDAGIKAWRNSKDFSNGTMEPWIFKVKNSDPSYFDEEEE